MGIDQVMSNGMVKLFAFAALLVFVGILSLLSVLPSSTAARDEESDEWNYAIIIDAGSTGSRLFLYKYRSITEHDLIDVEPVIDELSSSPVVKKVTPGLSSFRHKPQFAAAYIKPLLDHAVHFIPSHQHAYTSLFILATAGMRLLPKNEQDNVLKNLRTNLPSLTSIQIIPEHIRVIEGKWEGIYFWISVNYVLGRFKRNGTRYVRQPTVGILDMGGASVQLAIESNATGASFSETTATINLGCRDDDRTYRYQLYVTTFLGYGVNEALRMYEQKLSDDLTSENGNKTYVRDPCLPVNLLKAVIRKDGSQFIRKGFGDWDICVKSLTSFLKTDSANSECYTLSCFFGLVRAPPVSLSDTELYGFSEYWYSLEDVLFMGGPYDFSKIESKAREFCRLKWSVIQANYQNNLYPKANDERLRTQCFRSAWIIAVLHEGFSIDKLHNHFQSAFYIDGQEVHWALGAVLYHMRYFPLREVTQPTLNRSSHAASPSIHLSVYWLALVLLFFICIAWIFYEAGRKQFTVGAEPSLRGYMMLPQDQPYMEP